MTKVIDVVTPYVAAAGAASPELLTAVRQNLGSIVDETVSDVLAEQYQPTVAAQVDSAITAKFKPLVASEVTTQLDGPFSDKMNATVAAAVDKEIQGPFSEQMASAASKAANDVLEGAFTDRVNAAAKTAATDAVAGEFTDKLTSAVTSEVTTQLDGPYNDKMAAAAKTAVDSALETSVPAQVSSTVNELTNGLVTRVDAVETTANASATKASVDDLTSRVTATEKVANAAATKTQMTDGDAAVTAASKGRAYTAASKDAADAIVAGLDDKTTPVLVVRSDLGSGLTVWDGTQWVQAGQTRVVLYSSDAGATSVTLTETAANFSSMTLEYRNSDGHRGSVTVTSPNGVTVTTVMANASSSALWVKGATWAISEKSVANTGVQSMLRVASGNSNYPQGVVDGTTQIWITKVIGIR